jgi:hypothetical protein
VAGDVGGDEAGPESAGGEGVSAVEGTDLDALLIIQDGEVDGTGEVVFEVF